jgi:hypothetical protein
MTSSRELLGLFPLHLFKKTCALYALLTLLIFDARGDLNNVLCVPRRLRKARSMREVSNPPS